MILVMYWTIVCSVDQCLGEWVTCQSLEPRMAMWTLALVYQLQWEKITSEASTENCSDLSFVIGPRDFNAFGPFLYPSSMLTLEPDECQFGPSLEPLQEGRLPLWPQLPHRPGKLASRLQNLLGYAYFLLL